MRMAKVLLSVSAAWLATFGALPAFAGGALTAHVVSVRVDKDGRGVITFDGTITGSPPPCGWPNAFAFSMADAGGKAILATALTAKTTGAQLQVVGAGACTIYGNAIEDLTYGVLQ